MCTVEAIQRPAQLKSIKSIQSNALIQLKHCTVAICNLFNKVLLKKTVQLQSRFASVSLDARPVSPIEAN